MNYHKRWMLAFVCAAALPPALRAIAGEPFYELGRTSITGTGPTTPTGDGYELLGAVQFRGERNPEGDGFQLTAGLPVPLAPTDCDEDGGVTLQDYSAFEACLTGPDGSVTLECQCFDVDNNNSVDLADFARVQLAFTGP